MVPGQIQLPEPRNNTTTLHSLFAAQDVQRWYWSAVSFALISGHLLTDSWNPSLRHLVWLQQLPLTHLTHGTRFCLQHFVIEYIPIPVSRAWSDVKWIRGADLHSRSAGHKIMLFPIARRWKLSRFSNILYSFSNPISIKILFNIFFFIYAKFFRNDLLTTVFFSGQIFVNISHLFRARRNSKQLDSGNAYYNPLHKLCLFFTRAFAKFGKAILAASCLSVCQSARTEQLAFH